ncbi:MAG TPA: peptidoglycan editing factor PgeF [Rubrivivax sp.]|nr:peptidoglycan editing factor PgeF [Rubrivivax sp.]
MSLLQPAWPAPRQVGAGMSLRGGGVSVGPYASLNVGVAVGDDPVAVAHNRSRFSTLLGAQPVWLRQVHGQAVLRLHDGQPREEPADAAWTTVPGIACTVQVADCLPVLFAVRDGRAVGAAHAGWRGLAGGVLEATIEAICRGTAAAPADLFVWLGPCIGPRRFQVGADVLRAFEHHPDGPPGGCFVARPRADGEPRWLADLQQLAHHRLTAAGVVHITRAAGCTVEEPSAFFSFRRDGVTGRMAAAVWLQG